MENALYICSAKTKFANSCGIVIFDKDKLKSDIFIISMGSPSAFPKINTILLPQANTNFENEIESKFLPFSDKQIIKLLFFFRLFIWFITLPELDSFIVIAVTVFLYSGGLITRQIPHLH